MEVDIVVEKDETGGYVVFVPTLPGCHSQGDTLEEAIENIKDAIKAYLSSLSPNDRKDAIALIKSFRGVQRIEVNA